eukprot:CAMPEP_0170528860 /NCGR_PEP_ID=MMETSP0209-20121228/14291_1 /TAXON_ID=665100 ORGANISM="Litonotus pictus, Strain P1" /NCGR_SAMPLE_ID=MMETSP0209 /ASSEMBLY_ACC=CAM_ASM_000301 /LENGTH=537 /DNA_ID=CAMNT_0010820275 /DNA_START=5008 /DNA_END=6621 /DNA_ORIENTATION=-
MSSKARFKLDLSLIGDIEETNRIFGFDSNDKNQEQLHSKNSLFSKKSHPTSKSNKSLISSNRVKSPVRKSSSAQKFVLIDCEDSNKDFYNNLDLSKRTRKHSDSGTEELKEEDMSYWKNNMILATRDDPNAFNEEDSLHSNINTKREVGISSKDTIHQLIHFENSKNSKKNPSQSQVGKENNHISAPDIKEFTLKDISLAQSSVKQEKKNSSSIYKIDKVNNQVSNKVSCKSKGTKQRDELMKQNTLNKFIETNKRLKLLKEKTEKLITEEVCVDLSGNVKGLMEYLKSDYNNLENNSNSNNIEAKSSSKFNKEKVKFGGSPEIMNRPIVSYKPSSKSQAILQKKLDTESFRINILCAEQNQPLELNKINKTSPIISKDKALIHGNKIMNPIELQPSFKEDEKVIVVVDDSLHNRNTLCNLLRSIVKNQDLPITILSGNDGVDLLWYLIDDQENNRILCAFSDENMDYMNGSKAVEILRQYEKDRKLASLPLLICSTNFDDEFQKELIVKAGFDMCIEKIISKDKMTKLLKEKGIIR